MHTFQSKQIPPEPPVDETLLRLIRCLKPSEKISLIRDAFIMLAERCSFDSQYKLMTQEDLERELEEDDLDLRLHGTSPPTWPGQKIVDLDDLGAPGAWIEDMTGGEPFFLLFGGNDIKIYADDMGIFYLDEIEKQGISLPSDFAKEGEPIEAIQAEEEKQIKLEFLSFLRYWRETILQTLEKQNPNA